MSMVCARCGSDRIGAIQRGIDNWPVARCFNCGPKPGAIPDDDGTVKTRKKRETALRSAAIRPTGSQKAIHAALRPVIERDQYRPKAKPVDAPSLGMFDDTP